MVKNKRTVQDVLNDDYKYCINYDYDRNSDNCHCQDYCRCSTIKNTKINNINLISIAKEICQIFDRDEFTEYCLNRILTACKMYNSNYWDFRICRGYYGEEIDGIYINNMELEKWLDKFKNATTNQEKIFVALECEYGYILDEFKNYTNWTIETINIEDIKIGQQEHYKKLDRNIVDMYKNFDLPICVCIEKSNDKKLIDGYHRLNAKQDSSIKVIIGKM